MPHYKDGTEAKLGDEVIGQGYNVKHPISGTVVGIAPGQSSCNLQVAHTRTKTPLCFDSAAGGTKPGLVHPYLDIEYGQADAFERCDLYEKRAEAEKARKAEIDAANEVLRNGGSVSVMADGSIQTKTIA